MKKCSHCGTEYGDEAVVCAVDHTPLGTLPPPLKAKHSGMGIASFIISISVGALMVGMICLAAVLASHRVPGQRLYPGQMGVGLAIMFLGAMDVLAIGLGIAGLCQPRKIRTFAILGVVFSILTIVGVIGLMVIGLSHSARYAR